MTADERLASIRVKVERAKKHIGDLDAELRTFYDAKPCGIGAKRDPQTRRPIYYVTRVSDTPVAVAAITGDALHNLRSALDHLAYQLVSVGKGSAGPFDYVYFPIAESAKKYETGKMRKIQGMRPAAIKAIDAVKPYQGGNDTLWFLHKLDNVDKHRFLIAVTSVFQSVDVRRPLLRMLTQQGVPADVALPTDFNIHLLPEQRLHPVKAGDILFTDLPDAEVDKKMQFRFHVAFGEPGIFEGEPLLETLQHVADLVDNLVLSFRPLLA